MKKGFTLVELMVVIVVMGILAAIALPQFGNAIAKARAAEAPNNLHKISVAQEMYKVETKGYADNCYWGDASNPEDTKLGIKNIDSKYFKYHSGRSTAGFNANATIIKKIRNADLDVKVTLTESGKTFVHLGNSETGGNTDGEKALRIYLQSFLTE